MPKSLHPDEIGEEIVRMVQVVVESGFPDAHAGDLKKSFLNTWPLFGPQCALALLQILLHSKLTC